MAYELFFDQVCRKTRDLDGKQVPMLNKLGDPVYYQLQYFLDSEEENMSEEQKEILLQDPRYKDPITGKVKTFPYKTLLSFVRVQTEADNKEWLKAKWVWEGLRRDKQIEVSPIFEVGVYDHPIPVTELKQIEPKDKDSPYKSIVTAINFQKVYDVPFTKENVEKELAKRHAPKDERHIVMTLLKVNPSGISSVHALQVTDKE